jgi:hypothetical protein
MELVSRSLHSIVVVAGRTAVARDTGGVLISLKELRFKTTQ